MDRDTPAEDAGDEGFCIHDRLLLLVFLVLGANLQWGVSLPQSTTQKKLYEAETDAQSG